MVNKKSITEADMNYGYYSKVLNKPFDTVKELKEAEAAHYAELKAKEAKVTEKKDDAHKVEEAFKAHNQAKKEYNETVVARRKKYAEDLAALRAAYDADIEAVAAKLDEAAKAYDTILNDFIAKHPEGYHMTLKDGDNTFTLSSSGNTNSSEIFKNMFNDNWLDEFFNLFKI
jgi:membrane protein involved in colicin uptake